MTEQICEWVNCRRRRGLSCTAIKFGISFTTRFLNQGNALVIVHNDGTLQIATGATEMGQGVDFMMGSHKWHGVAPDAQQTASALSQLKETLGDY